MLPLFSFQVLGGGDVLTDEVTEPKEVLFLRSHTQSETALRLTPKAACPQTLPPPTHSLAQPGHAPNLLQKKTRPSGRGPVRFITKDEQDGQVRFLLPEGQPLS